MPATTTKRQKITPPELARRWGVSADKIVYFILAGELRAIDASLRRGERPRYLIDEDDIAAFEAAREVSPPAPVATRRKRSNLPAGFVRHFRAAPSQP
jgi:hypothetical protein